jgi:hypothetical protein
MTNDPTMKWRNEAVRAAIAHGSLAGARGGTTLTRFVAALTFASTFAAATLADADPLQFSAIFLETAPLRVGDVQSQLTMKYEAHLVNVGLNPAIGFILFCDAATGECTEGGPGCAESICYENLTGCVGKLLDPGQVCTAQRSSDSSMWVRLVLIRFGDKKPIDARGSFRVTARTEDGVALDNLAIEALPRAGTAFVTEAPAP